jgi:phosphoinositide-3-kinase regulatory subunit 4
VHTERVSSAAAAAVEASGPGAGTGVGVGAASPSPSPLPGSPARSPANARPPRSTIISLQQQQLLTAHLDAIVDIALLESPYGMVVSADRSGMIYVFR